MTFDEAFTLLLGHEGEYSNDPRDGGGATRWGVTEKVARASGYKGDMRQYPQEAARALYRERYWTPAGCEVVPDGMRFDLFDMAVNSGVTRSIMTLQGALGEVQDGVIGPRTLQALGTIPAPRLVARFNGARLEFMTGLPNWAAFSKGWARRIAANLARA